ncbi:unnamed protein product, partial [Medioppia subpectinata]
MDIRCILLVCALLYLSLLCFVFAAPVLEPKPEEHDTRDESKDEAKIKSEIDELGLEYGRYLQQVVEALEEDKEFAKKLENVSQDEIKNGAIARELDFVSHSVRNKLDELKRIEMDRLRVLARKEQALEAREGGEDDSGRRWRTLGADSHSIDAEHVDHANPHSFEAQDLQKLIVSASRDLEALDAKRRHDFKEYEMEKELRYEEVLESVNASERHAIEERKKEMEEKRKTHARVHHPGSKQQLEEVWESKDHMPRQEFDPKVFFSMHDVNGDGFLDAQEVEAILGVEVRKMYEGGNGDPNEMQEEYHRMREHIYKEADVNRDGLISKKEFLEFTKRMDFERDDEWKGVEETKQYTDEELRQYKLQREQQHRQPQHQQHQEQYDAYQQYVPQYYPQGYHYPPPEHFQPNAQLHAQQQYQQQQFQQQQHHALNQQQQQYQQQQYGHQGQPPPQ